VSSVVYYSIAGSSHCTTTVCKQNLRFPSHRQVFSEKPIQAVSTAANQGKSELFIAILTPCGHAKYMKNSKFEGYLGPLGSRAFGQPADHIRYTRTRGFWGIRDDDKEQWLRKHPHIEDFDLNVAEAQEWLSKDFNQAWTAEQRPRKFLDWWLSGKWEKLTKDGYK
jgi:hypothetical protein